MHDMEVTAVGIGAWTAWEMMTPSEVNKQHQLLQTDQVHAPCSAWGTLTTTT